MNVSTKQKILRLRARAISIIVVFAMIFGVLTIVDVPKNVKAEDYRWTIVGYNWVDISSTGTVIWQNTNQDDDWAGPYNIGFNFIFYGDLFNELYVGSNGYITFGYGTGMIPTDFPSSAGSPDNSIMPFGRDMYVRSGYTSVYYKEVTSPQRFIIQYDQLDYRREWRFQTFQIILYPNGDIITQYKSVEVDWDNPYVGIENSDGTDGVSYTATLSNNLAIKYSIYEHDIAVRDLQAPNWLEPGQSTFVNATIRNLGLNNETNILVNFTVDEVVMNSTTISFLESGNSTFVSFPWTPMVERKYTIGIEATPVPNENYIENNQQSKVVRVRYQKFVLFDQTHSTDSISYYSVWIDSLKDGGYVVETYTAGAINSSIFSGYDVFVIPQARSYYSSDERSAIQDFVSSGGGLFVIGDDYPDIYSELTSFSGINWEYHSEWWHRTTTDITPHEITEGVSSVYLHSPNSKILLNNSAADLVRDPYSNIMLAASEDPGKVVGFVDGDPLWNDYIHQADNLLLANNIIEWFIPYEHDIAVRDLQVPNWLEPGQSTFVNATIKNVGLSNETNILVNFTVDGAIMNSTMISFLESGNSTFVSFPWTPAIKGNYTVGIEAAPVPNENYTGNNQQSKVVNVRYIKGFILFDQTHSTDSISHYSVWIDSLFKEGYVVETYTAGAINSGIFSGYDVFVIPQARSNYSSDECSAIQDFVSSGGGLFVIGDDCPYFYSELTGFSGINWYSYYRWWDTTTTDITPHEITEGISSVYLYYPESKIWLNDSAIDLVRDYYDAIMLAVSENPGRVVGFADDEPLRNEWIHRADNLLLASNIIKWLIVYEHDIAVRNLQAPNWLEPGQSTFVNATIRNRGLNDETNILVNFTVDGVIMNTTTILFLETGDSTLVSFPWTPTIEGKYTVGIEVAPVPNENNIENNKRSKVVSVRYTIGFILFDQTHGTDDISYYSDWVDSLFEEGYIVDTYTAGAIDSSTFIGYDAFVIPQAHSYYSWDEHSAIQDFVSSGGGLFVVGEYNPWVCYELTSFAGIYWDYYYWSWENGTTTDITPHKITNGVSTAYLHYPESCLYLDGGAVGLVRWYDHTMLAVSENPGKVAGFADNEPLRNGYIHQADNLLLSKNIIRWLAGTIDEHDIAVEDLQIPVGLRPEQSAYVNATIRNTGLSNETNILVNFTVDGVIMNSTMISFLESENSTFVSFPWTPAIKGNYTMGIEVAPVPGEKYTRNNKQSKIVRVRYWGYVLFDQTHGFSISYYSDWIDSLLGEGYVVDTHTAGAINSSIFVGYDVFVIPPWSSYTMEEISAIRTFVSSGGGLFVIGSGDRNVYSELTGSAGIYWRYYWYYRGTTTDITPHEITEGVSSVYLHYIDSEILVGGSAIDLIRDPEGSIMLAVSEDPGRVVGFADGYYPLRNDYIHQADNLLLANNIIKWLVGVHYEHDIAVTNLQIAKRVEPGESTFVNASIRNIGLNTETNILVNFTVDGTVIDSTTVSLLNVGSSAPVSFSWTPMVEGDYNVSIEVAPILNENYTGNNQRSKIVHIHYVRGFVLFDQTHGTDSVSYYSDWIDSLSEEGYIVDTHTTCMIEAGTLIGYDVFVIPHPRSTYARDEISAIQSFVSNGGGLFVIGESHHSLCSYLTGFADIYWDSHWYYGGTTTNIIPHQITSGVSSVYLSYINSEILLSGSAIDLVRDPADGVILAVSEDPGRVAGFACLDSLQSWRIGLADNLLLANNIIEWLVDVQYEHDIAVPNLQIPKRVVPGQSTFVNASIRNVGLNNETNIFVNFTVDGIVIDSTTISFIKRGNSVSVSFLWTPMAEENYTVGIEAAPVPNENYTGNNQQSKVVSVRYTKGFVLFDQTHGTESISYYSDWVDSLFEEGYVVDTHTSGVINSSIFSGYDVFVIPQPRSTYTRDEVSAIQSFVSSGGGLFVIGTQSSICSYLTGFADIYWADCWGERNPTIDITPHPITRGVSSVYLDSHTEILLSGNALSLVRDYVGLTVLAASEDPDRVAGLTSPFSFQNWAIHLADNLLLANNIIKWLSSPSSYATILPTYHSTLTLDLSYTVVDSTNGIGVNYVELYYRENNTGNYVKYGDNFSSSPISFTASSDGFYEFYTIATDNAGNVENVPSSADASTIVDATNPLSNVDALTAYKTTSSFTITATATDLNGVTKVELWYSPNGADWLRYGNDTASPWSWDFNTSTTGGDGIYQFHTRAYDAPNNYEELPLINDTWTIIDTTNPLSNVDALTAYKTTSSFTITATALDLNSVIKVELWYSPNGADWSRYGNDTASPWSWDFDSSTTGGDGVYQFYTRAYDAPNNYEETLLTNDTWTIVDTIEPTMTITEPSSGVTITSSSVTITWSASDTWGIDHYEVGIDDKSYVEVGSEKNDYTFIGVSDGSHTITIKSVDRAGNSNETTLNIKVDTNPFSIYGPYKGMPLYLLIILIIVICLVFGIWLSRRKKKEPTEGAEEEVKEEIKEEEAEEVLMEEEEAEKEPLEETEVEKTEETIG